MTAPRASAQAQISPGKGLGFISMFPSVTLFLYKANLE
jgi:hypothetical protein